MIQKYIFIISFLVAAIFLATCKKDYDIPTGNNKVELAAITIDSVSYFSVKIQSRLNNTGGNTISDHGLCWGNTPNPDISKEHKSNGYTAAPADISATLKNLLPGKKYYIRSYAIIPTGTVYGAQNEFITLKTGIPVSVTDTVTNITSTTALCKGMVVADSGLLVNQRGICWSLTPNPSLSGNFDTIGKGIGSYELNVNALIPSTTYYIRAFAINDSGTSYGVQKSFITTALSAPTLSTVQITNIGTSSALGGGNITSDGGSPVTARGICWSATQNPTISNSFSIDSVGIGTFSSSLTGLTANSQYYARAYATNAIGTSYGNEVSFTTLPIVLPTLTTLEINNITINTAGSGGDISFDGGAAISSRGVCWSVNPNPTTSNNITNDGTGAGSFTSAIVGLINNTTYYVRAYATNSLGTAYGNQLTFNTLAEITIPTVITTPAASITSNSAITGGNVSSTGGAAIIVRGVCWSNSSAPSINGDHTTDGAGTGIFISNLTGLSPTTAYHIRAYATNSAGTAYGDELLFNTTAIVAPTVITSPVSAITPNSATSGGTVTASGGATVNARGVCWSTAVNPTLLGNHTTDGTGTGLFVSTLIGLSPATTYYIRAYATNSVGISYGNQLDFITTASATIPAVTTASVTGITASTATGGGNVTSSGGASVTARGVCWSTAHNPSLANFFTNDGGGVGVFVSALTGLTPSTLYYVRAYATNSVGTAFGPELSFTTITGSSVPTLTTTTASSITASSASSGGNVTADGGASVTARGVCWSINQAPSISDSHTTDGSGTGVFISSITGLNAATTYYVRAYATNSAGTAYGNEVSFNTLGWSCGSSITINHIAGSIAPVTKTVTYGTVTNIPGETSKCWITSNLGADHQATAVNDATEASAGWYWQFNRKQGHKHDGITLTPSWTITSISENLVWQPVSDPCTLELGSGWRIPTSSEWSNVDAIGNWTNWNGPWNSGLKLHASGYLGGSDGMLNQRGISGPFWSSSQDDYSNGKYLAIDNSNCYMSISNKADGFPLRCISGELSVSLSTLNTTIVSSISSNSAVSGGNISNDGGASVTARGVCWSTNPNPFITDTHTSDGTGVGSFVSNIIGLTPNTTYYVRAYATNSAGTSYGDQQVFASLPIFFVGQNYGGGIIFYIDGTSQHGLISATSDQSSGCEWGCFLTQIGGTLQVFGSGQANTTAIVNGCNQPGIAARICNDLLLNGFDDWFLPSKAELLLMYQNYTLIGGFNGIGYWSSSEYSAASAWSQNFGSGSQDYDGKTYIHLVRAVRAF